MIRALMLLAAGMLAGQGASPTLVHGFALAMLLTGGVLELLDWWRDRA